MFPFSILHNFDPPRTDCGEPLKRNGILMILEPKIMTLSIFMEIPELNSIMYFSCVPRNLVKSAKFYENTHFIDRF